jgi:hypothetical protein
VADLAREAEAAGGGATAEVAVETAAVVATAAEAVGEAVVGEERQW